MKRGSLSSYLLTGFCCLLLGLWLMALNNPVHQVEEIKRISKKLNLVLESMGVDTDSKKFRNFMRDENQVNNKVLGSRVPDKFVHQQRGGPAPSAKFLDELQRKLLLHSGTDPPKYSRTRTRVKRGGKTIYIYK